MPLNLFAQEMVNLMTHNSYPYHFSENSVIKGKVIRELKCAFNRLGLPYRVEMSEYWKNNLLLQDSKIDGLLTTVSNNLSEKYSVSSQSIDEKKILWFNFGAPLSLDTRTPEHKKLIVTAIYGSEEWYSIKREGYRIKYQPRTLIELFNLLLNNKVDAVASTKEQLDKFIRMSGNQGVSLTKTNYKTLDLKVLFSLDFIHENSNFLAKFNIAIDNCLLTSAGTKE